MQHTTVLPPYRYSHHQPNSIVPLVPPVLDLCTNTRNSSYSACNSSPTSMSTSPGISGISPTSKPLRPFKAISRQNFEFHHFLYNDSAFQEYRNRILSNVIPKNELCTSMRRSQGSTSEIKNPEYIAKRKKNNEAAKRSREARKMKEDEIALRCAFLEQENLQLRIRLSALESETRRLQSILLYPISNNGC